MKAFGIAATWLLLVGVLAGCASSEITQRQNYAAQDRLPRPERIIVYDIRATANDIPASSAITGHYSQPDTPQTAQAIKVGRQLGALVAARLVQEIGGMGMPSERAGSGPPAQLGDVLITGQFITIKKGERRKRVIIGFGAGSAEIRTHIEGYLVTERGHRLLGTRQVATAGKKTPGLLVPGIVTVATGSPIGLIASAVMSVKGEKKKGAETLEGAARRTADEIAKELKKIFQRQGWI